LGAKSTELWGSPFCGGKNASAPPEENFNGGNLRDVYVFMLCFSPCLMEIMNFDSGFAGRSAMDAGVKYLPVAVRHPIRPAVVL
jgi:hypothetical protein